MRPFARLSGPLRCNHLPGRIQYGRARKLLEDVAGRCGQIVQTPRAITSGPAYPQSHTRIQPPLLLGSLRHDRGLEV